MFVYDTDCDDNFYFLDSDNYPFFYALDSENFGEIFSESTREFTYGKNGFVRISYSDSDIIVHVDDGFGVDSYYFFPVVE